MSDDLFTNSDSNAASSAGFGSPLSTGPASAEFGGSTYATQPTLSVPAFDAAKSLEAMQRVRDLNIKPFGDNPAPTVLPPNMLALTPQLADKYPDIYNPTLFAKSMDTYGPRWGLDRATVLKTASNTAGGENQDTAASPPQTGQENAHRPDEDFTHNGVGYYRRNGQLYSAGSDDPNMELKVTPEVDAKIMKERAEYKPPQFNSVPEWQESAVASSERTEFDKEVSKGFYAQPTGDAYVGKDLPYAIGRAAGEILPWDNYRRLNDAWNKVQERWKNNEDVPMGEYVDVARSGGLLAMYASPFVKLPRAYQYLKLALSRLF